ncbi:hypothetical protein BX600DRAFT_518530 [Xylariales sp. PMI_506]|nr:hypothetical protein BX600DRAFT_518530 [Xylariales sp. PMI_506]
MLKKSLVAAPAAANPFWAYSMPTQPLLGRSAVSSGAPDGDLVWVPFPIGTNIDEKARRSFPRPSTRDALPSGLHPEPGARQRHGVLVPVQHSTCLLTCLALLPLRAFVDVTRSYEIPFVFTDFQNVVGYGSSLAASTFLFGGMPSYYKLAFLMNCILDLLRVRPRSQLKRHPGLARLAEPVTFGAAGIVYLQAVWAEQCKY